MKDYREYMRRDSPRPEYHLYPHKGRERDRDEQATQEVGCQYDIRRDTIVCTCRNARVRRAAVGYFGLPKQIYAYHGTRSFTDIGVGSVKTLMRKKVKKIYLPETDDRGVGSSDLSSVILRKTRQRENSYYDHKRTSSKCVGGIIEYNTGCVLSKQLSPIIQTRSGTTSPIEPSLIKNQEIGSSTVINNVITKTTQVDTEVTDKATVHNSIITGTSHNSSIKEYLKIAKKSKDRQSKIMSATKPIAAKAKEVERVSSSDSLEQHVHNLEAPSEEKPSQISVDPMENKLEREYRRIFLTKSKDDKPSKEGTLSKDGKPTKEEHPKSIKTNSDIKSPSVLIRRFQALRRGLAKKADPKRSAVLVIKASSQISAASHKDVSIASDPPSLESRSYTNTKPFSPYTSKVGHDRIYDRRATYRDSVSSGKDKGSLQWSRTDGEDIETQSVKGMFKLWGKKFNWEEDDTYCEQQPTLEPTVSITKKSVLKAELPKVPPKDREEKKEGRKFSFFKRKSKDKTKPYKPKKGITTGRCEVRDGLMIKIGGATHPEIIKDSIPEVMEDYDEIMMKTWLKQYLTRSIESRNSVRIRWNNKTYATSSSTVFELMDNVYKDAGVILKSQSEMTIAESPYYQSFTRQQVNFVYQNIEAWMIPRTIPDRPKDLPVQISFKSSDEEKDNIEIRISDQKWFIDKSKAFSHKIEVVLHSKNFVQKKQSSEYLHIDIPKGFFVDSSSDDKRNQSSDEQVYNIVEYETGSEIKKNRLAQSLCTGDNAYNNIEVTVNVKTSNDIEPKVLETVIKTPATQRDVVIQGSSVFIPKRCDVIGVGIITQRDLREIRKPILKIRDDVSEEESEHAQGSIHKNSKFAESYLQDYYRHWTPLGMDFYSWCVSDSLLRCCSENSKSTFNNQADGSRSCPNIIDDFQPVTVVSSCDTSSCSHCIAYVDNVENKENAQFFGKSKNNKKDKKTDDSTRSLPKDSIEVFKRRKIYALSNKSQWASADDKPYSVPSSESRGAQNTLNDSPKAMKPCCKPPEPKNKKASCKKHVSMSECDATKACLDDDTIPGILAFKGSSKCDACKDPGNIKTAVINLDSIIEIPQAPCKTSCEKIKKPPCMKPSSPTAKRSPVGPPCEPCCPLNKTPSPRSPPTRKPSPPAKKPCVPQCPPPEKPCPPGKKPCVPQCPSAVKPCPPEKKPCVPQCPSAVKPCPPEKKPCVPQCPSAVKPCPPGKKPCMPQCPSAEKPCPPPKKPCVPQCPSAVKPCPPPKKPSVPQCPSAEKPCPPPKKPCPPQSPSDEKPCPPPKNPCAVPQCPFAQKSSPVPKKPCPTKIPSPVGRKPCPPKCGKEEKPPHRIGDCSIPPGIKLNSPGKPSPTGSGSCPDKAPASPQRLSSQPSCECKAVPCPLGSPGKQSSSGSGSSPCKAGSSPLRSPYKSSPAGSGSSPCKSKSSPAGSTQSSPAQKASPIRKCCKSPPKAERGKSPPKPECFKSPPMSGESSPCPKCKKQCPNKKASPVPKPCPNTPPKSPLKACCSPYCRGIKPVPKCPTPPKVPESPRAPSPSEETAWCPLCKRSSKSYTKLPGPQEVTPCSTPKPSCCYTQKKSGITFPCAKLFRSLCKKSSKPKCKTPPCKLPPPVPVCLPKNLERRKSCGPCTDFMTENQEFPWPLKNQISNQSLIPKSQSAPNGNINKCADESPYSPRISAHSMIRIEGVRAYEQASQTCMNPPCEITKSTCCAANSPKTVDSPTQVPLPSKSKPLLSGIWLKMKPCKKKCSKETDNSQDYGCIRLSSKENLTIRMKAQTPSTEEIRDLGEGLNIRVQDDDGQTLYERRDYRTQCVGGQHRPSVLGDMYRNSNVIHSLHRISTQVIGEAMTNKADQNIKDKSDASLTNTIEIQFQMKVTQGEKTTEIGIANEDDDKVGKKNFKPPEEVFVVKNESVHSIESKEAKNDINIRIVIKNFKSKSDKKKLKCYNDAFSKEISDKFHTVSTGYSDNLCDANADNAYSVHRATVDLTASANKSKTEGLLSGDVKTLTDTTPINILKSVHSTKHKEKDEDTERKEISQIYKYCSDKVVPKEDVNKLTEKDFLKKDTTENDITDNDDTERSEVQKPSDFAKRNYLSDKYDYTDIDTEKDDYTEREDLTERDLTEKDDLTDRNDLTERDDLTEKDDLTGGDELTEKDDFTEKDDLTEKEDLNHTDDEAKKIENTKASSHKTPHVIYQKLDVRKSFQQNYEAPISTDTDEQDLILEANTSTENDTAGSIEVLIKPHTRDEKKEMLKDVFEKAHAIKVKSRTRMKKLRDMLKSILTSDSSGHDELKVNELAKDLTYASLKPNYFRDSDSMNNYYNCEPMSDKDSTIRPVVYPTEEKNSVCSKSSDVYSSEEELQQHKECMCNTLATRLNLCKISAGGCCCCKTKKKDEEIVCDLRSEVNLFDIKTHLVDVETQHSKYFHNNKTSVHSYTKSSIIETCNIVKVDDVPRITDSRKEIKPLRRTFVPHINHINECPMKKFNRDTILTISEDDKIVMQRNRATVSERNEPSYNNVTDSPLVRSSDILQSYEAKKAVLEIYAEKTVSDDGEHFVAKLPKFVYDRENEIMMNYAAIAANNYTAMCKKNVIMMSIKR